MLDVGFYWVSGSGSIAEEYSKLEPAYWNGANWWILGWDCSVSFNALKNHGPVTFPQSTI